MARMRKAKQEKDYVEIPNVTARASELRENENPISLEAVGLLVDLWSYPEDWEVRKTELYRRFGKNKKTSVSNAWDDLVDKDYIIEFKVRVGKRWEYVYIYNIKPFTEEQKQSELAEYARDYGVSSTSDFQQLKMGSSKCTVQNQQITKKGINKKGINKEGINKEGNKRFIDDEEEPFTVNEIAFREFIYQWEKNFPERFDNDLYNRIYVQMHIYKVNRFTFKEARIQARYMKEEMDKGLVINDYAAYFVKGILLKRTSQNSAVMQEKLEKAEKEYKERKEQENADRNKKAVPFYNWLEN